MLIVNNNVNKQEFNFVVKKLIMLNLYLNKQKKTKMKKLILTALAVCVFGFSIAQ